MDETTSPDIDDDDAVPSMANDPYSNIDGAFGNYMADEPQPMAAGKGSRGDLDDLLF
jgi:AP-2 complex subunit beta-1